MIPGSLPPMITALHTYPRPFQVCGGALRTVDMETKTFTGRMNGIIRVGKFSFENPRLVYHDGFNNLGSAVLKDFVVTLDPKNWRLELKRD
jgi:hypothetical protein